MKKVKKLIFAGVSLLVVAVLLVTSFLGQDTEVQASSRLSGIETVIENMSETDPFTIIEIVPDHACATLGYYVRGEEPGIEGNLLVSMGASYEDRKNAVYGLYETYVHSFAGDTGIESPITIPQDSYYVEQLIQPEDMTGWKVMSICDVRRGEYVEAENGNYKHDENGTFVYDSTGQGTHNWVDNSELDPTLVQIENLYYKVNVESADWFAIQVLELDLREEDNIKVLTMTPSEFEEMASGVNWDMSQIDIDMFYFSNSSMLDNYFLDKIKQYGTDNDFSDKVAEYLQNYIYESKVPVLLDSAETTVTDEDGNTTVTTKWNKTTEIGQLVLDLKGDMTVPGVNENICMLSDIVHLDFTTVLGTDFYGYREVRGELEREDIHNTNKGLSPIVENFVDNVENSEKIDYSITQSTLLKYIINYRNRLAEAQKSEIHVLDIEPTRFSTLTEEEVLSWMGLTADDTTCKVYIEQVSMDEFVGKTSNLLEEYDVIYIGDCIGPNAEDGTITEEQHGAMYQSNGTPHYDDANMTGMIYSEVGDIVELSTGEVVRYYGNDLTSQKLQELNAYVKAGYPVVYASKLISFGVTVSETSNMCAFLKDNAYRLNVTGDTDVDASSLANYINMPKLMLQLHEAPVTYNGETTSSLVMHEDDKCYYLNYTFSFTDLANPDGSESTGETGTGITYDMQLFLDENGDGRFLEDEMVSYYELRDLDGNLILIGQEEAEETTGDETVEEDTAADDTETVTYALKPNATYTLLASLPGDYEGIVSWKLVVTMSNQTKLITQASAAGISCVDPAETAQIKVLQLAIEEDEEATSEDFRLDSNEILESLFNEISDRYEIKADVRSQYYFLQRVSNYGSYDITDEQVEACYDEFLKPYDVLIVEFADGDYAAGYSSYYGMNGYAEPAIKVLQRFIDSGKSVIFMRDNDSADTETKWGSALNEFARNATAMKSSTSVVDEETLTETWTYYYTDAYIDSNLGYDLTSMTLKQYPKFMYVQYPTNSGSNFVSQVNAGQIATYPFDVSLSTDGTRVMQNSSTNVDGTTTVDTYFVNEYVSNMILSATASPYQLDLDYDKDGDGVSDVTVWHTLSANYSDNLTELAKSLDELLNGASAGLTDNTEIIQGLLGNSDYFGALPNNVRNHYYIYSIDNVIYTGIGDTSILTDYEAKLFVNTLIAAYNNGPKRPTIKVLDDVYKDSVVTKIYRTHDSDVEMYCDTNLDLYFYVTDNNIHVIDKYIAFNVFYEVPITSTYDYMIDGIPLRKMPYNQLVTTILTETEGTDGETDESTDAETGTEGDSVEADESIPSYVKLESWEGSLNTNQIYGLQISAEKLIEVFNELAVSDMHEIKLYFMVETAMYSETELNEETGIEEPVNVETSGEAYQIVTLKKRTLFNLD